MDNKELASYIIKSIFCGPDELPHDNSFGDLIEDVTAILDKYKASATDEPDVRGIVEALGFDPTNHHNAARCPYCAPLATPATDEAGTPYTEAMHAANHGADAFDPACPFCAASTTDEPTIPCHQCGERLPTDLAVIQKHGNERHPVVVGPGVNRATQQLSEPK